MTINPSARPAFNKFHKNAKRSNLQRSPNAHVEIDSLYHVYCFFLFGDPASYSLQSSNISGSMRMKFLKEYGSSHRSSTPQAGHTASAFESRLSSSRTAAYAVLFSISDEHGRAG